MQSRSPVVNIGLRSNLQWSDYAANESFKGFISVINSVLLCLPYNGLTMQQIKASRVLFQ